MDSVRFFPTPPRRGKCSIPYIVYPMESQPLFPRRCRSGTLESGEKLAINICPAALFNVPLLDMVEFSSKDLKAVIRAFPKRLDRDLQFAKSFTLSRGN